MSKTSLIATSILPALVGGVLCYLLVMAFLGHFDKMPLALQVVAGLTLLAAAAVVLMPIGILLSGPKGAGKAKDKAPKARKKGKGEPEAATAEEAEDLEMADEDSFANDFSSADEETEALPEDDLFVEGEADEFDMDQFPEDEGKVK